MPERKTQDDARTPRGFEPALQDDEAASRETGSMSPGCRTASGRLAEDPRGDAWPASGFDPAPRDDEAASRETASMLRLSERKPRSDAPIHAGLTPTSRENASAPRDDEPASRDSASKIRELQPSSRGDEAALRGNAAVFWNVHRGRGSPEMLPAAAGRGRADAEPASRASSASPRSLLSLDRSAPPPERVIAPGRALDQAVRLATMRKCRGFLGSRQGFRL